MNIYTNAINKCRTDIIRDIHGDVVEMLLEKQVLLKENAMEINKLKTQEDKNRKLLDILVQKCDCFEPLVESLHEWYPWLSSKLLNEVHSPGVKENKQISLAVVEGNVPPVPKNNVSRKKLLDDVRNKLKTLRRGYYVVLHGMIGCGKSCLAAEALNHDIILDVFKGKVLWISIGKGSSHDLWSLIAELSERLGSDKELDRTLTRAKIQLRKIFEGSSYLDGLVVLDDVSSEEVIKALNIGCRMLITTSNINIMGDQESRTDFIKVDEGFTEYETLHLLAQSVGIDVLQLPPQAKAIHVHSKGFPLTVSLIGAQLSAHREEAAAVHASWDIYVQTLAKKDYGNIKRYSLEHEDNVYNAINAIGYCVGKLNPELQAYFNDFALFVEDINITPQVLETLWNQHSHKVKSIMEEFRRRSLVVRKWNDSLQTYVYGIHYLLLYYLRKELTTDKIKELHGKLIARYRDVCNDDFSQLPQDNYMFYYLGYHLTTAEMYDLFPKVYLSLEFVEAKVRSVGSADLLADYRKYRDHITNKVAESIETLRAFEWFVEWAGQSLHRYPYLDVVQLGLQEECNSRIHKLALRLTEKRQNNSYLKTPLGPPMSCVRPHIIENCHEVTAVCFSHIETHVLVAFSSGVIKMLTMQGFVVNKFEGHLKKVTHLTVSPHKIYFLSCSEDCTVKVWRIMQTDVSAIGVFSEDSERTPSPRLRQDSYSELWSSEIKGESCYCDFGLHKGAVPWAEFSSDSNRVVSCSLDRTVNVWDIKKNCLLLTIISQNGEPTACTFSTDGSLIIYSVSDCSVYANNSYTAKQISQFISPHPVKSVYSLPGTKKGIVILTDCLVSVWDCMDSSDHQVSAMKEYMIQCSEQYLCCTVAEDGSYIAVATSDQKIIICHPQTGQVVNEFCEPSGNITCLATDNSGHHMLLGSCTDETIRVWKVNVTPGEIPANLSQNFSAVWPKSKQLPIVATPTNRNSVKVLRGRETVHNFAINGAKVLTCALTSDGEILVCSDDRGFIWLQRSDALENVLKFDSVVRLLRVFDTQKNTVIVAVDDRNCIKVSHDGKQSEITLKSSCISVFYTGQKDLLTVTKDASLMIWDVSSGNRVQTVREGQHDTEVLACDFTNSCCALVAVAKKQYCLLFQTLSGPPTILSIPLLLPPTCCKFSVQGTFIAVGFPKGLVQMWNVAEKSICKQFCVTCDNPTLDDTDYNNKILYGVKDPTLDVSDVCVDDKGMLAVTTKQCTAVFPPEGPGAYVQFSATHIVMAEDKDSWVTIDSHGNVHILELLNNAPAAERPSGSRNSLRLNLDCRNL